MVSVVVVNGPPLWIHDSKTANQPQMSVWQKEGLITWKYIHYLGPPPIGVKGQIGQRGPENGRYLGRV